MYKTRLHLGYLVGFALLLGGLFLSINQPVKVQNDSDNYSVLADSTCGSTSSVFANNIDTSRMLIRFDAAGLTGISRVEFVLSEDGSGSEKVIGKGVRDTANQQVWRMIWDTNFYDSINTAFPGKFRATVFFTNNTICNTPFSPFFSISANGAPSTPDLDAFINPPNWSTLVNTSINVFADFPSLPPDLHQFVIVKWQPDIGAVNSAFSRSTNYSSGPNTGNGKLRLFASYSGKSVQREIEVAVYSSASGSGSGGSSSGSSSGDESPTNTTSGGSSSTSNDTSSGSDDIEEEPLPEISEDAELDEIINVLTPTSLEPSQLKSPSRAIALVLQSNEAVKSCVIQRAGDEKIESILRENRRPRSDEFKAIVGCFEPQRNVIPSILAPVAPEDVKTQPESKDVIVRSIANAKKRNNDDDTEKTTLVLSGVAKPNADVLLYVFSEPLVLATTADSDGNWSYTLEDPIEPGDHEVYAMVDRGDGVYERSGVASFFIGTAEATEENPNGLSLELVSEPTITASNRSANLYIAATIGIVTFSAVVIIGYVLFALKNHRNKHVPKSANQPLSANDESSTYKSFVDGQ